MLAAGEGLDIRPNLSQEHLGGAPIHTRNRIQALDERLMRCGQFLDARIQGADALIELLDMIQHFAQHVQVMRPDASGQRRLQFRQLGAQADFSQISQRFRILHTSQQRRQHGLRRLAAHVADDRGKLQVGVSRILCNRLLAALRSPVKRAR